MTNAQAALIALHRDPNGVLKLAKRYLVGLDMIDQVMQP